jgi:hypothetical protein
MQSRYSTRNSASLPSSCCSPFDVLNCLISYQPDITALKGDLSMSHAKSGGKSMSLLWQRLPPRSKCDHQAKKLSPHHATAATETAAETSDATAIAFNAYERAAWNSQRQKLC